MGWRLSIHVLMLSLLCLDSSRALAGCDITADSCCRIFEEMGLGDRIGIISLGSAVHTFSATPNVVHLKRSQPTITEPNNYKVVEIASSPEELSEAFKKALDAEGVPQSSRDKILTAMVELTQNGVDAHIRNGTEPTGRRIVLRLKVRRRQASVDTHIKEPVDQILIEVADNAANKTAKKNSGQWFSGGRASDVDMTEIKTFLDQQSALLKNPVQIARERGLTKLAEWQRGKLYAEIQKEAEAHNGDIIKRIADRRIPPDIIAEYFDAKTPTMEEIERQISERPLDETARIRLENSEERSFWLFTHFEIREPEIAVESREGGVGGFGSVMMKARGSLWVYGPNRDSTGNIVGTRTLYVIETPSGSLTDPSPMGENEKGGPKRIYNPAAPPPIKPRKILLP